MLDQNFMQILKSIYDGKGRPYASTCHPAVIKMSYIITMMFMDFQDSHQASWGNTNAQCMRLLGKKIMDSS